MIEIRPAIPDDAENIKPLLKELGYSVDVKTIRSRLVETSENENMLVAVDEKRPIGLIALKTITMIHMEKPTARITTFVVQEAFRNRGIGGRLLAQAVEDAKKAGCAGIELTTSLSRTDTHEFYKANGFEATSLRFLQKLP